MFVYLVIMLLLVKLFKYDLFMFGVVSLVNIGGMVFVLMFVVVYNCVLILVGVIMVLMGFFLGIYFGMMIVKILGVI